MRFDITKFEKVSLEQFEKDMNKLIPKNEEEKKEKIDILRDEEVKDIKELYNILNIPTRATFGSAGYDFKAPFSFKLKPGETILIPTGISVFMRRNQVLMVFPRSGHGFKYRIQLDNSVAIVDADYCYSDNEGHIMIKLTNDGHEGKELVVKKGEGFCQGIFVNYGITDDDYTDGIRNGGFGSTDK